MKEWLRRALPVYSYFTIREPGMPQNRRAMQLLSLEEKTLRVKTFSRAQEVQMKMTVRVQPLETWEGKVTDHTRVETFKVEEPVKLDILELVGHDPAERRHIKLWSTAVSAVDGCLSLVDPREAIPPGSLKSGNVPLLCLVDALVEDGWVGETATQAHGAATPRKFDSRVLASMKARLYFQALLGLEDLLAAGAFEFTSEASYEFSAC